MSETNKILNAINKFSNKGWFPGGNGGLAVLHKISDSSQKVYVTPSSLKNICNNDLYLLRSLYGTQDIQQPLNKVENSLQLSPWVSIFLETLGKRNAGCVAALHTKWTTLAGRYALQAWRQQSETYPNLIRLSHWGLIKDFIGKHEMTIPVINYAEPEQMQTSFSDALRLHPECCAILIRDYAIVLWESSLSELEARVEILDRLCELQIADFNLFSKAEDSLL